MPTSNLPKIVQTISSEAARDETLQTMVKAMYYKKNFRAFVEGAWDIIEPGTPYSHNWHIDYLTEEVLKLFPNEMKPLYPEADWDKIQAETTRRQIINVPTRSMKTLLVSVLLPTWLVLHKPTLKIATISYSDLLATEINNKRRMIISSDWYQKHFSDIVRIDKGSNRQDRIEFESRGVMFSTSIAGTLTGMGADVIILDDPQKPGSMGSPAEREKAINFFRDTLPTRLNDRNTGIIINIQQRLHFEDLSGYIMKNIPGYEVIKIPLSIEQDMTFVGPLTGTVWEMKEGDVLWESRMDKTSVEMLRAELGGRNFEAQQQQNPTPDGGAILDLDWFEYYDKTPKAFLEDMREFDKERFNSMQVVLSWDMNYTVNTKNDSDYVGYVATVYDPSTDSTYILDAWKKRLTFMQTLNAVIKEREKYEDYQLPIIILIEKKANGGPIIQVLDQKVAGIKPFEPGASNKVARMESASPTVESGHVLIPDDSLGLSWATELVSDLVKFPYITHDDIADAFSQAIIHNHIMNIKKEREYNVFLF